MGLRVVLSNEEELGAEGYMLKNGGYLVYLCVESPGEDMVTRGWMTKSGSVGMPDARELKMLKIGDALGPLWGYNGW